MEPHIVTAPLPPGTVDYLRRARVDSQNVMIDLSDGRPVPNDFTAVPPDGLLLVKARPSGRVLRRVHIPREFEGIPAANSDMAKYANVQCVKFVAGTQVCYFNPGPRPVWPEQETERYERYREAYDQAVAEFQRAHERLREMMQVIPL